MRTPPTLSNEFSGALAAFFSQKPFRPEIPRSPRLWIWVVRHLCGALFGLVQLTAVVPLLKIGCCLSMPPYWSVELDFHKAGRLLPTKMRSPNLAWTPSWLRFVGSVASSWDVVTVILVAPFNLLVLSIMKQSLCYLRMVQIHLY